MKTRIHSGRSIVYGVVSALVAAFVVFCLALALEAQAAGNVKQAVVTVHGMQCPFCAYGIKKHLAKLPGAEKVEVELAKNQAVVTFAADAKVNDEQIRRAVRNAGFTTAKIEWPSKRN